MKNKKYKLVFLLFVTFCLLKFPISSQASLFADSKHILILNSYQSGFPWTDDQLDGILSSLSINTFHYTASVEYLDWKQFPSQENLSKNYDMLKYKYENQSIDLIICTDDAAFNFATSYRSEFLSNAPIVFSGINEDGYSNINPNIKNYTGVLEKIDPKGSIEIALSLNPKIDTVYLIYENTESGLSTGNICIDAIHSIDKNLNIISLNDQSVDTIITTVENASKNSLVLITAYFSNMNGSYIDPKQFCERLGSVSPVPLYHLYDYGLNKGILGGYLAIGRLQGEEAGKLANRILNGEHASDIPIVFDNTNQYIFDYDMMKKFNISKNQLPKNSVFINEPFSFFKTYRILALTISGIMILLTLFAIVLLFYIKKIHKLQKHLKNNNEELTQLYEELAATEEEIRFQYTQLATAHEQLAENNNKLYQSAHHDSLTGLYNRLYLYDEIVMKIENPPCESAFYFVDLDNFKYINDALGHNIGDELLRVISLRLQKLSGDHCTLIRLGGDEFIFIVTQLQSKDQAELFAGEILGLFNSPFKIQGNLLSLTASIGISMFPDNGNSVDALLRNADMAMYKAKSNGKNGYLFFNQLIKDEVLERINIERYFQKALDEHEFSLHYQPQIMTETLEIDGFEALIRWESPELGFLSPLKFIHIAEETGFIIILGEWVIRNACEYILNLNTRFQKQFKISVNISAIQLFQEDFVALIRTILDDTNFPPHLLELEITESVIMESVDLISEKLREIQSLGIQIALDDFGTGYSSFAYLKNIPISTLKVDKLFVDDITDPDSQVNLADTIIDLGHKMNLTIVAEGVETKEQAAYLRNNGCDKIQGYFYSKPLPIQSLETWISEFS